MFWLRNEKIIFSYALLSGGLRVNKGIKEMLHILSCSAAISFGVNLQLRFYSVYPDRMFPARLGR